MAITWRGEVVSKGLIQEGRKRLLRVRTVIEIFDDVDPSTVLKTFGWDEKYELDLFNGMTAVQIRDAIVVNGIGHVPALKDTAAAAAQDWIDSAVIRSIVLPHPFGP